MARDGADRPVTPVGGGAATAAPRDYSSGGGDPADPVRPGADKSVKHVNRTCD